MMMMIKKEKNKKSIHHEGMVYYLPTSTKKTKYKFSIPFKKIILFFLYRVIIVQILYSQQEQDTWQSDVMMMMA